MSDFARLKEMVSSSPMVQSENTGECAQRLLDMSDQFDSVYQVQILEAVGATLYSGAYTDRWLYHIDFQIAGRLINLGEVENGRVKALVQPALLAYAHERYATLGSYFRIITPDEAAMHRERALYITDPMKYLRKKRVEAVALRVAQHLLERRLTSHQH